MKILVVGIIILLCFSVALTIDVINQNENVYEYLSDGEFDRPLTNSEIEYFDNEFESKQERRKS